MAAQAEILKAARALIEDRIRWTQHTYARGKSGRPVYPEQRSAVSWCALGAICKVTDTNPLRSDYPVAVEYLRRSAEEIGFTSVELVNDGRFHSTVLRMFDRAIELAEQADTHPA